LPSAEPFLEKVTAFVLRPAAAGRELLIFRHPTAGYQLPAGTVEPGEDPLCAAVREVAEETGLAARVCEYLGTQDRPAPAGWAMPFKPWTALRTAPRADAPAEQLARSWVLTGAAQGEYVFVRREERNLNKTPARLLWAQEGWVLRSELALGTRRHFYRLAPLVATPADWDQLADQDHVFHLFWVPAARLPQLAGEQNEWLAYLPKRLYSR
jgi:8-oxo-dGTP pyrophosphatase MutT (NUDIX family)